MQEGQLRCLRRGSAGCCWFRALLKPVSQNNKTRGKALEAIKDIHTYIHIYIYVSSFSRERERDLGEGTSGSL